MFKTPRGEARSRSGPASWGRRAAASLAGIVALVGLASAASGAGWVLAPGPEGQDVSYYSFIQTLNRGQYATMYVHTSFDENGIDHHAETFIRFDLPPDLLQPGETVLAATLLLVFAFTFDHGGNLPEPNGEISISPVLQDWHEDSLNFQTQPFTGPPIQTITGVNNFGTLGFDVTEQVQLQAHGMVPNYGFKFSNPFSAPMGFHTFESNVDPSLKARMLIVTGPGELPGGVGVPVPGLGLPGLLTLAASLLVTGRLAATRLRRRA